MFLNVLLKEQLAKVEILNLNAQKRRRGFVAIIIITILWNQFV